MIVNSDIPVRCKRTGKAEMSLPFDDELRNESRIAEISPLMVYNVKH